MSEPIVQAWKGEAFYAILKDEKGTGFLGRARETLVELTPTRLRCKGRRAFGLRVDIPLESVTGVGPKLVPFQTLDIHGPGGRIEIPAGAHDFVALQELGERIEEAARACQSAIRQQTTGEAALELGKLAEILDKRS